MIRFDGGVLSVSGAMTLETVAGLKQEASAFIGQGVTRIDLGEVTEADSAGLALLLEWLRRSGGVGASLGISELPRAMSSLAALYGLSGLFPQ